VKKCLCGHARSRHVKFSGPEHDAYYAQCVDCASTQRRKAPSCAEYRTTDDVARALAERTSDAYSFDRYGEETWRRTISRFLALGFTERETEAVMRSKWTRWAADQCTRLTCCARNGRLTSLAVVYYIQANLTALALKELVEETF